MYVSVTVKEKYQYETNEWLGVDLGINNIATDSERERFSGAQTDRIRRKRTTARKQHQRKGTKKAKRKLKRMSGRQSRFQKQTNHYISKQLVKKAKALGKGIALEDLHFERDLSKVTVRRSKAFRRRHGNWSFAHLRFCIEYKAKRAGVPVKILNPAYSSCTCLECGCQDKRNRKGDTFKCILCDHTDHADIHAALTLSAWAENNPASKVATS